MASPPVIPTAPTQKVLSWSVACLEPFPPQQESAALRSAEAARDSCSVPPPHCQSPPAFRNLDRAARHPRLGTRHAQRAESRARELGRSALVSRQRRCSRQNHLALPGFSNPHPPHHPFVTASFL